MSCFRTAARNPHRSRKKSRILVFEELPAVEKSNDLNSKNTNEYIIYSLARNLTE